MHYVYSLLKKVTLTIGGLLFFVQADAITYTALASGTFSSTSTWGGAIPSTVVPGDLVVIPDGVTVTLDADLAINGTLSLNSGTLVLNGYNLAFGSQSNLVVSGTGSIHSDISSDIAINTMYGFSSGLVFGAGNNVVNNLSINPNNPVVNINMGSDLLINGTLTIATGTFSLNGNDLAFVGNGDFSPVGNGLLISTSASDIDIMSNGSFTGALRFGTSGYTVNNLTVNFPYSNSVVSLGTDLKVNGMLTLGSGKIDVKSNDLVIAASGAITGGSDGSYVITSQGGHLTRYVMANSSDDYPVGTTQNYCPALVYANAASVSSDISVSVANTVYANGYNGQVISNTSPLVDATWYVTSNTDMGLDLNFRFMWSAGMEVNGFDRANAFIAQHNGINWDAVAPAAATSLGGMFYLERNNVSTLSPFIITDNMSALDVTTVAETAAGIVLYPNPAVDVIHYTAPVDIISVDVFDITGRKVKTFAQPDGSFSVNGLTPGYYSVQLAGKNYTSVQKIIKAQ